MVSDKQGIQVIARAARILRELQNEPDGLSLGELSDRLCLPRSTIQRIVGALREEQLTSNSGTRARITLGPALGRLAASATIEMDRMVRPILQTLATETGETVNLSILRGHFAVLIDQILGTSSLIARAKAGETQPLHSTAKGKALLACINPAVRATLLRVELERFTAATIVDPTILEGQLAAFEQIQLMYDLEEHGDGICAIGTSFLDPLDRVFAVSVPMPATRFARQREIVGERLLVARQDIMALVPHCRFPPSYVAPA